VHETKERLEVTTGTTKAEEKKTTTKTTTIVLKACYEALSQDRTTVEKHRLLGVKAPKV